MISSSSTICFQCYQVMNQFTRMGSNIDRRFSIICSSQSACPFEASSRPRCENAGFHLKIFCEPGVRRPCQGGCRFNLVNTGGLLRCFAVGRMFCERRRRPAEYFQRRLEAHYGEPLGAAAQSAVLNVARASRCVLIALAVMAAPRTRPAPKEQLLPAPARIAHFLERLRRCFS